MTWPWPRWALASGQPPGHFSEEERRRLVAGGGGSRRTRRTADREAHSDGRLPLWVTVTLILAVTGVWSATYIAAIVNPDFSPDGFVGPAILAVIPLVSTYHIVINRKGRDE